MQALAPVVSRTEARRCCKRPSWIRRHRDPGSIVCYPDVGLEGSQCCVVKGAPAGRCMAQLHAILEIMSPPSVFAPCIYAARETFLKMLRTKRERFHVYFLVIRIQSTRPTSLPAPTGFYVGQAEVTQASKANKLQRCDKKKVTEVASGAVFVFSRY